MSQTKAQRSRTSGLTMTGTRKARAAGAAVCKVRVNGEAMMRLMPWSASATAAASAWA